MALWHSSGVECNGYGRGANFYGPEWSREKKYEEDATTIRKENGVSKTGQMWLEKSLLTKNLSASKPSEHPHSFGRIALARLEVTQLGLRLVTK